MEFQNASAGLGGPLSPLSPTSDYGGPGPSHGPSLSPSRGPSPDPGLGGASAAFNYNQLEGRFKQLQGETLEPGPHPEVAFTGPHPTSLSHSNKAAAALLKGSVGEVGSTPTFCHRAEI